MSEEITKDLKPIPKRQKFGRNQIIACVGYAVPLVMTYALVLSGKLDGPGWVSYLQLYVPVAMGTVLAVSGALKIVQALKGIV